MGRATDCSGALHLGLQNFDLSSIRQTSRALPSYACHWFGPQQRPRFRGPEENEEGFYANGGIYNPLLTQACRAPFSSFGLMCVKRSGPPGDAADGPGLVTSTDLPVEQVTH
jgi:hypothetical protein